MTQSLNGQQETELSKVSKSIVAKLEAAGRFVKLNAHDDRLLRVWHSKVVHDARAYGSPVRLHLAPKSNWSNDAWTVNAIRIEGIQARARVLKRSKKTGEFNIDTVASVVQEMLDAFDRHKAAESEQERATKENAEIRKKLVTDLELTDVVGLAVKRTSEHGGFAGMKRGSFTYRDRPITIDRQCSKSNAQESVRWTVRINFSAKDDKALRKIAPLLKKAADLVRRVEENVEEGTGS